METFELRYFVEVARNQNIHRASERLNVSPGSLSKAIARLEAELAVKLFEREGRGISITPQGVLLLKRASQIIELEESTRIELQGDLNSPHVILAGPEVLLFKYGTQFATQIQNKYPRCTVEFLALDEDIALKKVDSREAHFAICTGDVLESFDVRILDDCSFVTVAGMNHSILKKLAREKIHAIENILEHSFISPNSSFLGKVGPKQSLDGWRDDKFQRKIKFRSSSLKLIEEVVSRSEALAYLPDHVAAPFVEAKIWQVLKVSGCPYSCKQKIRLVAKAPIETSWIRQVF